MSNLPDEKPPKKHLDAGLISIFCVIAVLSASWFLLNNWLDAQGIMRNPSPTPSASTYSDSINRETTTTFRPIAWDELMAFLASDQTDSNVYDSKSYDCIDYAVDLVENAHKQNIKAWVVGLDFYDRNGHSIVGFETTDRGFVFIEPQDDAPYTTPVIGEYLCDANGSNECDGRVKSILFVQCDHASYCSEFVP